MAEKSKKRVLIVDDEPQIGKIFGIKLRLSGYDVTTTPSGAEAIDLVRTQPPDIILLDVLMPDVTGFDVLDRVRAFSKVPIIMFTAKAEIARHAARLGANDFISKPLDPERLVAKIESVLSGIGDRNSGHDGDSK